MKKEGAIRKEFLFLEGCKDALPIALGYLSVSFAFGLLAIKNQLPVWAPMLTSLTNFTGTGQFVGTELLTSGAALFEIGFTVLIINLRYLLMSLSLSQRLPEDMPLWQRLIVAFGNTDEIYAVSMQRNKTLQFRYLCGLIFVSYFGWNLGTVLGAAASSALPASLIAALGITIYAMFIAIIVPPMRGSKPITVVVILSIALSCLFYILPIFQFLGSGWSIIICGIVSSALGAWLFPAGIREEAEK